MKRAIISDIHGNLAALEAVLAHIRQQQVSEIFCLGDVVGYGPDPNVVVERVQAQSVRGARIACVISTRAPVRGVK